MPPWYTIWPSGIPLTSSTSDCLARGRGAGQRRWPAAPPRLRSQKCGRASAAAPPHRNQKSPAPGCSPRGACRFSPHGTPHRLGRAAWRPAARQPDFRFPQRRRSQPGRQGRRPAAPGAPRRPGAATRGPARTAIVGVAVMTSWVGSPNFWSGRAAGPPIAVVLHTMAGSIDSCDAWFSNPRAEVSAHYGVGLDGAIHAYVRTRDTAWANGILEADNTWVGPAGVNPNRLTVSIESEDLGDPSQEVTDEEYS